MLSDVETKHMVVKKNCTKIHGMQLKQFIEKKVYAADVQRFKFKLFKNSTKHGIVFKFIRFFQSIFISSKNRRCINMCGIYIIYIIIYVFIYI